MGQLWLYFCSEAWFFQRSTSTESQEKSISDNWSLQRILIKRTIIDCLVFIPWSARGHMLYLCLQLSERAIDHLPHSYYFLTLKVFVFSTERNNWEWSRSGVSHQPSVEILQDTTQGTSPSPPIWTITVITWVLPSILVTRSLTTMYSFLKIHNFCAWISLQVVVALNNANQFFALLVCKVSYVCKERSAFNCR